MIFFEIIAEIFSSLLGDRWDRRRERRALAKQTSALDSGGDVFLRGHWDGGPPDHTSLVINGGYLYSAADAKAPSSTWARVPTAALRWSRDDYSLRGVSPEGDVLMIECSPDEIEPVMRRLNITVAGA